MMESVKMGLDKMDGCLIRRRSCILEPGVPGDETGHDIRLCQISS